MTTTPDIQATGRAHFIELERASKIYHSTNQEYAALRNVDLSIARGQFVAVVGESGSGKSTLLNVLSGIDRLTSGEVRVGAERLGVMSQKELSPWRGRTIGIVFQFFQLIPTLSVVENVMLPMDFCGVHAARKRRSIARDLLERLGIAEQADKPPSEPSGGQQQRAAIARSLANDPPILMADEPTGNLDSAASEAIISFFEELSRDGKTLIMVTHSHDLAVRAERIVTLKDGRIEDPAASLPRERAASCPS